MDLISYDFKHDVTEDQEALKLQERQVRENALKEKETERVFFLVTEKMDKLSISALKIKGKFNIQTGDYEYTQNPDNSGTEDSLGLEKSHDHIYNVTDTKKPTPSSVDNDVAILSPKILKLLYKKTTHLDLSKMFQIPESVTVTDISDIIRDGFSEMPIKFYPFGIINSPIHMMGKCVLTAEELATFKIGSLDFENTFVTCEDNSVTSMLKIISNYHMYIVIQKKQFKKLVLEQKEDSVDAEFLRSNIGLLETGYTKCTEWYEYHIATMFKEFLDFDFDKTQAHMTLKKFTDVDWKQFSDELLSEFAHLNVEYGTRVIHVQEVFLLKTTKVEDYETSEDMRDANAKGLLLEWPQSEITFTSLPTVEEVQKKYQNLNDNVWKDILYTANPGTMPKTFKATKNYQFLHIDAIACLVRSTIAIKAFFDYIISICPKGQILDILIHFKNAHLANIDDNEFNTILNNKKTVQQFYLYLNVVQLLFFRILQTVNASILGHPQE